MAIVSFRSKYITVAIVAAIVVSLAVGFVLVLENRYQHATLLDTTSADARNRVLAELSLRSAETSRRIAERIDEAVLLADRNALRNQIEDFKRDATLLGVVVRDVSGRELYAWRRDDALAGSVTRSIATPVRAEVETMPGIHTPQTVGEVEVEVRSQQSAPDSPMVRARPLAEKGNRPMRYCRPLSFTSCSVSPTVAISGQV